MQVWVLQENRESGREWRADARERKADINMLTTNSGRIFLHARALVQSKSIRVNDVHLLAKAMTPVSVT